MAAAAAPAARTAPRPAFVFDANRCTGCDACRLACTIENRLPWNASWRQVLTFNPERHPSAPLFHLSLACNHCERPLCMEACPALAYRRDANGAVLIDPGRCIGCGYCAWACPYDAPRMDARAGVMTKCTFCTHRLSEELAPACASACPTGALSFARLTPADRAQPIAGFPAAGIGPAIRIVPLRAGREVPDGVIGDGPAGPGAAGAPAPGRVSLAHEWSLAAFTLAVAGLAAFAARAALGWGGLSPIAFAGAAAGAMALGALHLGRKERAWRAILNLRTSWLAREIAAFALFAIVATGWSAWRVPAGAVGRGAVLATAALALFAVDRVYRYAQLAPRARPHSGGMFPAAGFLLGLLSGRGDVALAAGGLQFALYARRHLAARGASRRPWWLVALRAGVGLALPLALWGVPGDGPRVVAVAAGIAGLAVDRAEFYLDLGFRSPQRQMADDLARRLAGAPARG